MYPNWPILACTCRTDFGMSAGSARHSRRALRKLVPEVLIGSFLFYFTLFVSTRHVKKFNSTYKRLCFFDEPWQHTCPSHNVMNVHLRIPGSKAELPLKVDATRAYALQINCSHESEKRPFRSFLRYVTDS